MNDSISGLETNPLQADVKSKSYKTEASNSDGEKSSSNKVQDDENDSNLTQNEINEPPMMSEKESESEISAETDCDDDDDEDFDSLTEESYSDDEEYDSDDLEELLTYIMI